MRLAVVVLLAALVALPLAANAAQPPTRWAVSLNGRVVERYDYGNAKPRCPSASCAGSAAPRVSGR